MTSLRGQNIMFTRICDFFHNLYISLLTSGSMASKQIPPLWGLLLLFLAGCSGDYPQNSLQPRSDFAQATDVLFDGIFWLAVGVFVVVEALLLWTIFRYRYREGGPEPKPVYGHTGLEIAWTIAPAVILIFIAVPTIRTIIASEEPPRDDAITIEVVGHQWWWEFRYPEYGIVTANEMHIPVDRQVTLNITSDDVIHSFWLPRLSGKRDAILGRQTQLKFVPDSIGEYFGQCAEFCGTSHANMRVRAYVSSQEDFDAWVANQQLPAAEPEDGSLAAEGKAYYQRSACIACHTIDGVSQGQIGPDLTHFGARNTFASGLYESTTENLVRWVANAPSMKPGMTGNPRSMPEVPMSPDQAQAVVAYLQSLR